MSVARELADLPSASPSTDANFDNGTFVIDVSQDLVGIGTTAPLAKAHFATQASNAFSTTYNNYTGDGIHLSNLVGGGQNNVSGAISFSSAASIGQRGAAVVGVQTSSDQDQIGLAFYTHPSATYTDVISEALRITHDGKVGIGTITPVTNLTVDGTLTLKERAEADTNTATYGQLWVNTASPNELYFTADDDTDIQLTTATGINAASTGKAIAMAMVFGG